MRHYSMKRLLEEQMDAPSAMQSWPLGPRR